MSQLIMIFCSLYALIGFGVFCVATYEYRKRNDFEDALVMAFIVGAFWIVLLFDYLTDPHK